jgi:hypothetical protein
VTFANTGPVRVAVLSTKPPASALRPWPV